MAARPVVGIICCNRIVGVEPAQAVMERYVAAALRYADVAALLVPSLADLMTADDVADRLDGVLLTGSPSNIGPAAYGESGGEGPFDAGRDSMAFALVDAMIARSRPVFGICRGFQEINVALGGTLRRDAATSPQLIEHHAPAHIGFHDMFEHYHDVALAPDGVLAAAHGKPALTVNSVHFQGVARLAEPLKVEAYAADGLIEAFSATINRSPVLAVQWHPEWATESDADRQIFFHLLGRALRGEPLVTRGMAA